MTSTSPLRNSLNEPFWQAASEGRLMMPFCESTGRAFWPPSAVSPFVTGGKVAWRSVEPVGTLRAIAVYRRVFDRDFASLMPYAVALIDLDAGPRFQAHLAHPDAPDAPRHGDRVRLHFTPILEDGPPVPVVEKIG
jgi:hypothetical protein